MDMTQILLLTVVALLSLLLVVLGVQVFLILKELKNTLSKANKVLDDAGVISGSISRPVESLSTVLSGVKIGSLIASFLMKQKKPFGKTQGKREDEHAERT